MSAKISGKYYPSLSRKYQLRAPVFHTFLHKSDGFEEGQANRHIITKICHKNVDEIRNTVNEDVFRRRVSKPVVKAERNKREKRGKNAECQET